MHRIAAEVVGVLEAEAPVEAPMEVHDCHNSWFVFEALVVDSDTTALLMNLALPGQWHLWQCQAA